MKSVAKKEQAKEKEQQPEQEVPKEEAPVQEERPAEKNEWQAKYEKEHDGFLRLAAEFDNFRKRSQKEKDVSYTSGKADTVAKLLPVYDNLERALKQETEDAAFKKGVEMTMTELVKILTGLGVEIFGNVGDSFDPNMHNAVMHMEDESLGQSVITQVFQKGFKIGDKVVRFAMVQVAN
jgi:molecular chaperone GrpE